MMKKLHFLFAILLLTTVANANTLHYKMTATDTDLTIGQTATVTVSAWLEGETGTNGLDTIQLDMDVDNSGIVAITDTAGTANITLIAPDPDPSWSTWDSESLNNPKTGQVRQIAIVQELVGAPSLTGIGDYSDIFSFEIIALAAGNVTYSVGDFGGTGFFAYAANDNYYENGFGFDVVFEANSSDNTFTVNAIPEPASIMIFSMAAAVVIRKRKLSNNRRQ